MSSFLLFLDHEILKKGSGFKNTSSLLYPTINKYAGMTTYSTPFKQLVNDTSIPGANVMTGVYLNNTFVPVGQSGLMAINHYKGTVEFSSPLPASTVVSGNYAVKDINIEFTANSKPFRSFIYC